MVMYHGELVQEEGSMKYDEDEIYPPRPELAPYVDVIVVCVAEMLMEAGLSYVEAWNMTFKWVAHSPHQ